MISEIKIHHFEDEPENLSWLPYNIFAMLYERKKGFKDPVFKLDHPEKDAECTFSIGKDRFLVRYILYATIDEFNAEFYPGENDILIIDLMEQLKGSVMKIRGDQVFEAARKRIK